MTLIAFCGKSGVGKSTAALHLVEKYGFHRVRLAGPLKAMMRALGLSDAEIEGDMKESPCDLLGGRSPRFAMQTIGTEWGREFICPDLWVNAWGQTADALLRKGERVVVDDCRFMNEAQAIWTRGGKLVMIERPNAALPNVGDHESERLPFACDARLVNSGGRDFFDRLFTVIESESDAVQAR